MDKKVKMCLCGACLALLCSMPTQAWAGFDLEKITTTNVYGLYDEVDLSKQLEDISGKGWQWKAALKQLYLSGVTVITSEDIQLPGGSEIILAAGTENYLAFSGGSCGLYADGDLTISGPGSLLINSDSKGIVAEGRSIIEAGQVTVDAVEEGISAESYLQNGGTVQITANEGVTAEKVIINNGQLIIAGKECGIMTANLALNEGLMELHAYGYGMMILDGQGVINSGTLKIGQASGGTLPLDGVLLSEQAKLTVSGGDVEIYARETALGGVMLPEQTAQKIEFNGGRVALQGSRAMNVILTLEAARAQEAPPIDSMITVSGDIREVNGLSPQRLETPVTFWDSDQAGVQYCYGYAEDGQLASRVTLVSGQKGVQPAGLDGFYVDGRKVTLSSANEGQIYIDEHGRTMVPLRTLSKALGYTAQWREADQSITLSNRAGDSVIFYLNQPDYVVNGERRQMDTTALSLPPGRAHVPLRFAAESLGAAVEMRQAAGGTPQVMITTTQKGD